MFVNRMRYRRVAGSMVLLGMAALVQPAIAGERLIAALTPQSLAGDYGFTTLQSCVRTPYQVPPAAGFDPTTHALLVPGEAAEGIGSGVMSFERDGTVKASVLGAELSVNQLAVGQKPANVGVSYSCEGSYALLPDNGIEVNLPSCLIATADSTQVVTVGPLDFKGYVGIGVRSVNLSLIDGIVQKLTVADTSGNVQVARERICIQSLSLSRGL